MRDVDLCQFVSGFQKFQTRLAKVQGFLEYLDYKKKKD